MMQKGMRLLIFCLFLSFNATIVLAKPVGVQTIVFFRHGEKPFLDMGQLVCKGLNRALALPRILEQKFGKPDFIFASKPFWDDYFYYVRAFITAEPTAILYGMSVETNNFSSDVDEVVQKLLSPAYHQSLLFVAWEHNNIVFITQKILEMLGDHTAIPDWPGNDYDSLYVLTIDWRNGSPTVLFTHDFEGLDQQSAKCFVPPLRSALKNAEKFNKVIIVPDAEPGVSPNQLSCKGLNRALLLSAVISKLYTDISVFLLPRPTAQNSGYYLTSLMTIEPTIISLGGLYIPVSLDEQGILNQLKKWTGFNDIAVVTWPYEKVQALAQAIYTERGGRKEDILPMPDRNFFYELTFQPQALVTKARFKMIGYAGPNTDNCPAV